MKLKFAWDTLERFFFGLYLIHLQKIFFVSQTEYLFMENIYERFE